MGKGGEGGGCIPPVGQIQVFSSEAEIFLPIKKSMVSVMVYPLLIARDSAPLL